MLDDKERIYLLHWDWRLDITPKTYGNGLLKNFETRQYVFSIKISLASLLSFVWVEGDQVYVINSAGMKAYELNNLLTLMSETKALLRS